MIEAKEIVFMCRVESENTGDSCILDLRLHIIFWEYDQLYQNYSTNMERKFRNVLMVWCELEQGRF